MQDIWHISLPLSPLLIARTAFSTHRIDALCLLAIRELAEVPLLLAGQ